MPQEIRLEIDQVMALVEAVLTAAGLPALLAAGMAQAMTAAERDGLWQQGLMQALACADYTSDGRVNAQVEPTVVVGNASRVRAGASGGFVWPAIAQGLRVAAEQAADHGHCTLDVGAGAYAGALTQHLEGVADRGLVALGFGPTAADETPAAMALPRRDQPSLVIDLTAADLAQGHLLLAQDQHQPLPSAWALDDGGSATDDAGVAAQAIRPAERGRMALVLGLMAAAIDQTVGEAEGSVGAQAGHRFILIDPLRLGATDFEAELDTVIALAMMDHDRPLPGAGQRNARARAESAGLCLSSALHGQLLEYASR